MATVKNERGDIMSVADDIVPNLPAGWVPVDDEDGQDDADNGNQDDDQPTTPKRAGRPRKTNN